MKIDMNVDPIISLWRKNFEYNYTNKLFERENSKPLSFIKNTRPYQGLPIVLVVAGPSLDKNIAILKEYQNNCIIICADVAFFKLCEHNIVPDFVANIDPHSSINRFWQGLDTTKSIFVSPTTTHPDTINSWKGRILFFNQLDDPRIAKGIALNAITKPTEQFGSFFNRFFIGATLSQVASLFNPKVIILMGYDFGFSENKAYCSGFLDRKLINTGAPEGSQEWKDGIETLKSQEVTKELEVSGIGGKVSTTRLLKLYKDTFVEMVKRVKIRVINSTEGGILTETERMLLTESLAMYCSQHVAKKDIFVIPKRKRKKRK
jgi:hypothetical protein